MVVVAEVDAEKDVDERGTQLAHRDVRLAAQVDGLERLEESPAGPRPRVVVMAAREAGRSEQPIRLEDLASVLRGAGRARRPDLRREAAAVQAVHQTFQEAGLDAGPVSRHAADERPLIEVDEPDVRIGRCLRGGARGFLRVLGGGGALRVFRGVTAPTVVLVVVVVRVLRGSRGVGVFGAPSRVTAPAGVHIVVFRVSFVAFLVLLVVLAVPVVGGGRSASVHRSRCTR